MKGLALSQLASGKDDDARAQIANIKQLKGQGEIENDLHFQTQMAFYYLARGKTDEAAEATARALVIEPRYSWGRIAAAEVEMATDQSFEAEKHLLSALRNADFPTLRFTLGKLYLVVEDFDGAVEQFNKMLSLTSTGKFKTRLGGVLDFEASGINELIARERQAAILLRRRRHPKSILPWQRHSSDSMRDCVPAKLCQYHLQQLQRRRGGRGRCARRLRRLKP
jgi:tetratricopeptide (TPR) repeat protein